MIYICTRFTRKYLERFQGYGAYTISILIITTGHYSVIIVHGVTVLALCTSSDHGLYLYQVLKNILNGLRVMERTDFNTNYYEGT